MVAVAEDDPAHIPAVVFAEALVISILNKTPAWVQRGVPKIQILNKLSMWLLHGVKFAAIIVMNLTISNRTVLFSKSISNKKPNWAWPVSRELIRAPVLQGHTGADQSVSDAILTPTLLWLNGTLAGLEILILLDSGATLCSIAERCVQESPRLQKLTRKPHGGPGLMDANSQVIKPSYVILAPIVLGKQSICLTANFVVIKSLPYSCIIGLNLLNQLKVAGVDSLVTNRK